jgi:hypothetical protein
MSKRRRVALATVCLLVVLVTSLVVLNPVMSVRREDVFTLEPYLKYDEWQWFGEWFLALDLPPFQNVTAPFLCSWCADCVPVPVGTDCSGHCSAFLSAGIPNEGSYIKDTQFENQTPQEPIGFIDGMETISDRITLAEVRPLFLLLPAQFRRTSLLLYIGDNTGWSPIGTPDSPQVLLSGHLRVFLNEAPMLAYTGAEELLFGWSVPPEYDASANMTYTGIVDLTNSTLGFVWFGSATIHVTVRVDYTLYSRAAGSVSYLSVKQSCLVERRVLTYLGIGRPRVWGCSSSTLVSS